MKLRALHGVRHTFYQPLCNHVKTSHLRHKLTLSICTRAVDVTGNKSSSLVQRRGKNERPLSAEWSILAPSL